MIHVPSHYDRVAVDVSVLSIFHMRNFVSGIGSFDEHFNLKIVWKSAMIVVVARNIPSSPSDLSFVNLCDMNSMLDRKANEFNGQWTRETMNCFRQNVWNVHNSAVATR